MVFDILVTFYLLPYIVIQLSLEGTLKTASTEGLPSLKNSNMKYMKLYYLSAPGLDDETFFLT